MNDIIRRYTFKLYPNAAQEAALHEQRRMMAALWNAGLQMKEDYYRRERKTLSIFEISKQLKDLRRELPEWGAINSGTAECVLQNLEKAFAAFFRRLKAGDKEAGYPQYRRVAKGMNIPFRNRFVGWKFKQINEKTWTLAIKGIEGLIRCRGTFPMVPLSYCDCVIMFYEDNWWLSVVVKQPPRMVAGNDQVRIEFDLIDTFANVKINGKSLTGSKEQNDREIRLAVVGEVLHQPCLAVTDIDELKSERDRRYKKFSYRWKKETRRIARHSGKQARRRKDALHNWTTKLVNQACDVTVVSPKLSEVVRTPRGNEQNWGAAVETVSKLNEKVQKQAPGLAISMLSYKSVEAGIGFEKVIDKSPKIAIGQELVAATKVQRRLRRKVKELENV